MENFINTRIEMKDVTLNNLLIELRNCFDARQDCFAYVCKTIYKIWNYCKNNYWKAKDNEYYNCYKLLAKFGFDKKAVHRYKNCYERFIYDYENDNNLPIGADVLCKVRIKSELANFTPSKLFELLVLSDDTAKELIKPTMNVKEIRQFIKQLKEGPDKASEVIEDTTIDEDEISMAYDPKKEYEYSYFESMTKNQLLNIVWELQKAYQKLKKNKENKQ